MSKLSIAQNKVQTVTNIHGSDIKLTHGGTQDDWGEDVVKATVAIKAFPIRYSPFNRKVRESVGWSLDVDVLCYIGKREFDLLAIDIETCKQVIIDDKRYDIYKTQLYSQMGGTYIYYIVGGKLV